MSDLNISTMKTIGERGGSRSWDDLAAQGGSATDAAFQLYRVACWSGSEVLRRVPWNGEWPCQLHDGVDEHGRGTFRGKPCVVERGVACVDTRFVFWLSHGAVGPCAFLTPGGNAVANTFAKGYPSDPSKFGAGYEYLRCIRPTGRHRAGRVLGAYPLLADFVRVGWLLGVGPEMKFPKLVQVEMGSVAFDERKDSVDAATFVQDLIMALSVGKQTRFAGLVRAEEWEVVGAAESVDSSPAAGLTFGEFAGKELEAGCAEARLVGSVMLPSRVGCSVGALGGMVALVGAEVHEDDVSASEDSGAVVLREVDKDRVLGLKQVLEDFGLDLRSVPMGLLAELSTAHGQLQSPERIRRARLWEVLGDTFMRHVSAGLAVESSASLGAYSQVVGEQSNERLSALFVQSNLYRYCDVGALPVHSKGNADVFEAIVGLVSWYCPAVKVVDFLVGVGVIVPPHFGSPMSNVDEIRNVLRKVAFRLQGGSGDVERS